MKVKLTEVVYRQDLYPRFELRQDYIQKYAHSIEHLPPIILSQANILIDGYHRLKAHQLAGIEEIEVEILQVESEKELKKLAYKYNAAHGIQLTDDEKRKYAVEMAEEMTNEELGLILSVDQSTVSRWTKNKREDMEAERNRKITQLYLRAWNTQQGIAKELGVAQQTVSNVIDSTKNVHLQDFGKTFKPYVYNIWNIQKQDNAMARFGAFPQVFMENLLHYHTEPLDIVYDPFAGGGTTVDACKKLLRRYYCTDRVIVAGREDDIREHDIRKGVPDELPKPGMVFLDPPYSLLAKGEYSQDSEDLGNMEVDSFFDEFHSFINDLLKKKRPGRIAYVIRPFWNTANGDWKWIDPMLEFYRMVSGSYDIECRYVMPYSTEQYNGLWVNRAKESQKCLILNRELTVFARKGGEPEKNG